MQTQSMRQTAFLQAVTMAGGQPALAKSLNEAGYQVTQQTISNWCRRLQGPPAEAVPVICNAVNHQIKPYQLRPDVFPAPLKTA